MLSALWAVSDKNILTNELLVLLDGENAILHYPKMTASVLLAVVFLSLEQNTLVKGMKSKKKSECP